MKGAEHHWGLTTPEGWKEARLAVVRGCVDRAVEIDLEKCLFKVPEARGLILLFGDSHAASVSDGVVQAASKLQLDVAIMSTTACPALIGREPTHKRCKEHQDARLKAIEILKPQIVVIANRSSGYTMPPGPTWRTIGGPNGEHPRNQKEALEFWSDGMRALLVTVAAQGAHVVWVSVVPEFESEFEVTLFRQEVREYAVTKQASDLRRGPVLEAERAVIADFANVSVVDPADVLCVSDVCPAHVGNEWRYMDKHHLAPAGSRLLAPLFEQQFREALVR